MLERRMRVSGISEAEIADKLQASMASIRRGLELAPQHGMRGRLRGGRGDAPPGRAEAGKWGRPVRKWGECGTRAAMADSQRKAFPSKRFGRRTSRI